MADLSKLNPRTVRALPDMEQAYRLRCLGLTYEQIMRVTGHGLHRCFMNASRYVEVHLPDVPKFPTLSEVLEGIAKSEDLNAHRVALEELALLFRGTGA